MSRNLLRRNLTERAPQTTRPRRAAAVALGLFLVFAGTSHLSFAREEFQAQVPDWVPLNEDTVVLLSGIAEIGLGAALTVLPSRRVPVGLAAAAFFIAIFPGNISQYVTGTDAFGLDSDQARLIRLFFQPLLVLWALWSTGSWQALRAAFRTRSTTR
ncbi:hypothetical protein H9639_04405 [Arthrobacter sp. Sa2CUA1]|uniref:DoxX family membrane protein n=1 Tax=Arthrobacter gallicola TaxID=2762225 RepID=A0ABR8UQ83_9MICC|nr:hypothetical protein [Arthrobacter gallicola]MBD7994532.1 hypothetical protein [Arthrobacter gallicola]